MLWREILGQKTHLLRGSCIFLGALMRDAASWREAGVHFLIRIPIAPLTYQSVKRLPIHRRTMEHWVSL